MSAYDDFPAPKPEQLTETQQQFADFVLRNTSTTNTGENRHDSRNYRSGSLPLKPEEFSAELEHYTFTGDPGNVGAEPVAPHVVRRVALKFRPLDSVLGILDLAHGEWTLTVPDTDEAPLTDEAAQPLVETLIKFEPTTE